MQPGRFITFEGVDGCGKTTQFRAAFPMTAGAGKGVIETVEPGGTAMIRQIRKILLDPDKCRYSRSHGTDCCISRAALKMSMR